MMTSLISDNMRSFSGFIILLGMFMSLSAEADECFRQNPRLDNPKNIYQALQTRTLDRHETSSIRMLLKNMTMRWYQGSATRIICSGMPPKIRQTQQHFSVQSYSRRYPPDHFHLTLNMDDIKLHEGLREILDFYLLEDQLRFQHESRRGEIELMHIDNSTLKFATQYRNLGSITETHWEFTLNHDKLLIVKQVYGQGVLGERTQWHLQRR